MLVSDYTLEKIPFFIIDYSYLNYFDRLLVALFHSMQLYSCMTPATLKRIEKVWKPLKTGTF